MSLVPTGGSAPRRRLGLTAALAGAMAVTLNLLPGASAPRVVLAEQVTFEGTVADLANKDPKLRGRAVDLLKASAYPESAVPLAALVTDPVDDIQLSAIAAELNIFLAQKVTPKKRVAFLVEVRGNISAEPIFAAGPSVLGVGRVPSAVAIALVSGALDRTQRVAVEALYAFGALAGEVPASERTTLLRHTAPLLAGLVGAPDPTIRLAVLRVVGRVFAYRQGDPELEERLGDAVIAALNDYENAVRETAMWALGQMKYQRSVQGLSELLTFYRKGPLAERAFDSIARIGHEANMPQFVEQLSGRNPTFRMIAVEGIARSGDRERMAGVQTLLTTEKHDAIVLAGHFANVLLAGGAVTTIVESLDRPKLHDQAWQYVVELAPGRTAAFGALIRPKNGDVRVELIDALGISGDAAALPVVKSFADDKDPVVALAAQRAVARLSDVPAAS